MDPRLLPFVAEFEQDCGVTVQLQRILVAPTAEPNRPNQIGYCEISYYNRRSVRIDPTVLELGEWPTRILMYHELGHCSLDLDHSNKIDNLMYPEMFTSYPEYYEEQWATITDKLCGKQL